MSRLASISYLLAAVCIIALGVSRFLLGGFIPFMWIPIGLFVVFIAFSIVIDRHLYLEFLSMKTTKHGMNMGLMLLLALVAIFAINFISLNNEKTFDVTPNKVNSLADQSIKVTKELGENCFVRFFYKEGAQGVEQNKAIFQQLVRKYSDVNSYIKLEFVEANKRPDLAEEYGVNQGAGIVFIDFKGKRARIDRITEQEVTQALLKVTKDKENKVYFLTGHGELKLDDQESVQGLHQLKNMLEGNRYTVESLNLLEQNQVPEDADVLVIAGAVQQILDPELTAIKSFLQKGGNLFIGIEQSSQSNMDELLSLLGVQLENNFIVTNFSLIGFISEVFGQKFSSAHKATQVFKDGVTVFRLPTSLKKREGTSFQVEEIVGVPDSMQNKPIAFKDKTLKGDRQNGPFSLVMSVSGTLSNEAQGENQVAPKEFKAIIAGDSEFFGNQLLFRNLNRDLFLNSLGYLVGDEAAITIAPRSPVSTQISMDRNAFIIYYVIAILLPILLLTGSAVQWFRRRHA